VVFSDPNEFKAYEPDFGAPVRMDLRRWEEAPGVVAQRKANETDNRPLFEKYQFFTPGKSPLVWCYWGQGLLTQGLGIFMAFIVLAVILSILGVGLKALASLEVSYGAFDKEMGPAAQKKQM
jgi:hypothetical protein